MGLYNFQPRFVPFILTGKKTHTIRATRVHPDKPGNTLYLYTGLRTKKAKLLMCVDCVKVQGIDIAQIDRAFSEFAVAIDGIELDHSECEQLARRDGFYTFKEMCNFWITPRNRLPFTGHIIHWKRKTRRL